MLVTKELAQNRMDQLKFNLAMVQGQIQECQLLLNTIDAPEPVVEAPATTAPFTPEVAKP